MKRVKTKIIIFLLLFISIFGLYSNAQATSCIGWDNTFKTLKCYPTGDEHCKNPNNVNDPINGEGWKLLGPWFGINAHNETDCAYLKTSAVHFFCQMPDSGKCYAKSSFILIGSACDKYPTAKIFNSYYECCLDKSTCTAGSLNTTEKPPEFQWEVSTPTINIRIPGLTFADIEKTVKMNSFGKYYAEIPWIGQYFTSIYSFSLSIVSIVAVVMLIVQGMIVMTSAGGERKAGAYKKIWQVLVGLGIMWGSYLILYNINPALVKFESLKVQIINQEDLTDIDKGDDPEKTVAGCNNKKPITDTTYDLTFKKVASMYSGIDWRLLKAIAFMESGLDSNCVNKVGFTGLFQFKESTCPKSLGTKCQNLTNPEYNTQAAAIMLKKNTDFIKKLCPKADEKMFYTLLYMSHNSGTGAVACATKTKCSVQTTQNGNPEEITSNGSCTMEGIKQGVQAFWVNHWKYKAKLAGADAGRPLRTYNYSVKTADQIISLINKLPK